MDDALDTLAGSLRDRLVDGAGEAAGGDDPAERIASLVEREAGVLDPGTRDALAARVAERAVGLGPLEPLLRDGAVDEIMVCGTGPVWVERGGRLEATAARFGSEAELRHAIERILAPLGRRADEAEPLADARLPDGSRVHVVLPPLALDGPVLTIRRFRPRGFAPADLVAAGTLRRAAARVPRPRGAGAVHAADLRRDRLGEDDDARRARRVRRPGGADRDDRGRRRAAARRCRTSSGSRRGRRTWRAAAR